MRPKTPLSPKHHQAALLVAEDDLSDEVIAERVGVHRATLARWKDDDAFSARVEEIRQKVAKRILSIGIARRENRIRSMDRRHRAYQQIIDERAAAGLTDRQGKPVPGGSTGLVTQKVTPTEAGLIYEYVTDTATSAEMRALEKQAGLEEQEYKQRIEVTGKDGTPLTIKHETDFDFDAYRALFASTFNGGGAPSGADGPQEPMDTP